MNPPSICAAGMVGSSVFLLSEYLTLFLQRIGDHATMFQFLDGQELLPYQCAVLEEQWRIVRSRFRRAYALQKTAYRHARGGSTAPALCEDVAPRFRDDRSLECLQQRLRNLDSTSTRIVVRNTFVEMEEEDDETEHHASACMRSRTVASVRDCLVLAN